MGTVSWKNVPIPNFPQGWELQNMLTVCLLIAQSALARRESRGVHFRSDHPDTDDQNYKRHIEIKS